jgi:hypothetical protein
MSKNEWKKLVGVAGRILLAFVFVFSQTALAGQNPQTKDKSQSPQKAAAEQAAEKQSSAATTAKAQSKQAQGEESESSVAEEKVPNDGSHQGIKVHGHWTIEVHNLDGSLVRHVEFENSLAPGFSFTVGSTTTQVSGGADYLAALLTGRAATPIWFINLYGPGTGPSNAIIGASTTNSPCIQPGAAGYAACGIELPSTTSCPPSAPPVGVGCNLSVSTLGTPPTVGPIQLSGSVAATQNGQVSTVVTGTAGPCIGVANCPISGNPPFTMSSNFPGSPISVSTGQLIAVTVVISFS